MMSSSLAICILAAFLALGTCLQCEVCKGPGTNCVGALQTCAAGNDFCGSYLFDDTIVQGGGLGIWKRCMTSMDCEAGPLSINFGNGRRTWGIVTCCVGDACRTASVTMPPADTKPNGRSCRGCSPFESHCQEHTVECTGAETQCYYSIERQPGKESSLQGCATEDMCALTIRRAKDDEEIRNSAGMGECRAAFGAASTALGAAKFLPALTGLLLVKLLS